MIDNIIDDEIQSNAVSNFIAEIERIRRIDNLPYMDAILEYCESNELEIEVVAKFISKNLLLKSKIQQEAEDLNFLPKTSKLPI